MQSALFNTIQVHPFRFVLALAAILFAAVLFFVPARFAENDDVLIMLLLSGGYSGQPESLTVFQNQLFAEAVAFAYTAWPDIPWYPAILLATVCVSAAVFPVCFAREHGDIQWSGSLVVLVLMALAFHLVVQVQYTTIAGLAAAAGVYALLTARTGLGALPGAGLLVFAFMLRFEAAALATAVLAPAFLLGLRERGHMASGLAILALALCAAVALEAASNQRMSAKVPAYMEFNALRGKINDNGLSALTAGELPEGVSENDYRLFRRFFADAGAFGQAELNAIQSQMDVNLRSLSLRDWIGAAADIGKNPIVALALILPFLFGITSSRRLSLLVHYSVFAVVFLGLWSIEVTAILKNRVALVALTASVTGLLFFASPSRGSAAGWLRIGALSAALVFLGSGIPGRLKENADLRGFFSEQASVFSDWTGKVIVYRAHLRVEGAELFSGDFEPLEGKALFAGWLVNHPANEGVFEGHVSLLDPGTALFYHPGYGEEVIEMILVSLQENHGVSAEPVVIAESRAGRLVKFVDRAGK